jgi:hypothetical protein
MAQGAAHPTADLPPVAAPVRRAGLEGTVEDRAARVRGEDVDAAAALGVVPRRGDRAHEGAAQGAARSRMPCERAISPALRSQPQFSAPEILVFATRAGTKRVGSEIGN